MPATEDRSGHGELTHRFDDFLEMVDDILGYVHAHGCLVLVDDDPHLRQVGFRTTTDHRWRIRLTHLKMAIHEAQDTALTFRVQRIRTYLPYLQEVVGRGRLASLWSAALEPSVLG